MSLQGTFTAMITPFIGDRIDEKGLVENIQRQIEAKVEGLVFLGTTGESSTLTEEEKKRVIEIAVQEGKGKTILIIGTGSNSTAETIRRTKQAKELGADMALVVTPYYNKPTQEGIVRHFEAIIKEVDFPIIVYNIQGRTGVNIDTFTLLRLASLPGIIGVKEASGNIAQVAEVLEVMHREYPFFSVLSGDDGLTLPMMVLGAKGVISVISNLVPIKMKFLVQACLEGQFEVARRMHEELFPLFKLAFIEVNPIPIKQAMHFCGYPAGECRLPLCEMRLENREKLHELLSQMEIA